MKRGANKAMNPKGLKEILAGKKNSKEAWPTLTEENLKLDPQETHPEQDIVDTRAHYCQIRVEGDKAHSYHRNGKYIGTVTLEKLNRLKERYNQAV